LDWRVSCVYVDSLLKVARARGRAGCFLGSLQIKTIVVLVLVLVLTSYSTRSNNHIQTYKLESEIAFSYPAPLSAANFQPPEYKGGKYLKEDEIETRFGVCGALKQG
jgi:hypothetical protein